MHALLLYTPETLRRSRDATGGIFVTDVSNAARTCLMDIHLLQWDPGLLERFRLSTNMLPRICSNAEVYSRIKDGPLAGVPIAGALPSNYSSCVCGSTLSHCMSPS